ncbi:MAG: hypothetical protein QXZ68_04740 [Candidatus Bathyarchaeia archaeon]
MIRDGFDKAGAPDPAIWIPIGNPIVSGGALYLKSSSDGVRGKTRFAMDASARVTVKVSSGSGDIFITPYEINERPDTYYPPIPYYRIRYVHLGYDYKVTVSDHEREYVSAWVPRALTAKVQCSGSKMVITAVGADATGNPITVNLAEIENRFYNLDVALYLFGGATNIDYVEAGSGRELQALMMTEQIFPVIMTTVALVVIVLTLRHLIRGLRGIAIH